jgi:ribonuclease R
MYKQLKTFFKKNPGTSFRNKDIAKKLNVTSEDDYRELKSLTFKLYSEQFLTKNGKRYKLNTTPDSNSFVGEFRINQAGYGFVIPKNNKQGDIFISARNIGNAFHGDTVEVELFAKQKGKNIEGRISKIKTRAKQEIVGLLKKSNSFYFVTPDDSNIHRDIYISKNHLNNAGPGDKVILHRIQWENGMLNPEAEVFEIIGKYGTLDTEVYSIAREFNLATQFPQPVLNEAENIDEKILKEEEANRRDFREKITFTIDPKDAKDFDDALSIELLDNGNFSIGVHIADVSHFVKKGSKLDKEAHTRGNSVYFVGKAIPMLPDKLSGDICSLVQDKDRLTFSVIFEMTASAKIINYSINKTIIRSRRRFTYAEVQVIIDEGNGEFSKQLIQLNELAKVLRSKRIKEGSFEFHTPEIEFELDANGHTVKVERKELKESNMLIEEFMLLANKTIANHIVDNGNAPFVFRVHDLPDQEKMEEFTRFVNSLGFRFNPHKGKPAAEFHKLMTEIKGNEEEALVNELAIRSMAKACYSPTNIGHYGLGFKFYTHFTSPIRRYADLIVHRIIGEKFITKTGINYSLAQLDKICEHISACERNSIEAERLSVKMKQLEYLKDKIGFEFHAIISGVTNFGLFVKLTDILAEGLIRVRDLEGDFYVFNEKKYSLIGRKSKKQFRLGDKIIVKLVRVDLSNNELDFITVD